MIEAIIAIGAILVSIAIYIAGRRHGERLERELRAHERQTDAERRLRDMASKVADEYVKMARSRYDAGPHALATIGLDHLGTDGLIRDAIQEMQVRSGSDPWQSHAKHIEDIDLVQFFKYVREQNVNFFHTTVEEVAREVRGRGGTRRP